MAKISTFKNNDVAAFKGEIVRETDKAFLVRVANIYNGHKDVWFPKSQIETKGNIILCKFWLIAAKARETGAAFCAMSPEAALSS